MIEELKELKKEIELSRDEKLKCKELLKGVLLNEAGANIPSNFELVLNLRSRVRFSGIKEDMLTINIVEKNDGSDNRAGYFWTNDSYVALGFKDGKIRINRVG